jgi:hypothetical protein
LKVKYFEHIQRYPQTGTDAERRKGRRRKVKLSRD